MTHLAGTCEATRLELRLSETLRIIRANGAPVIATELRQLYDLADEHAAKLRKGTAAHERAVEIRNRLRLLAMAAERRA